MTRTLAVLVLLPLSAHAQTSGRADGQAWWSTVKTLADDKLEGRETGSAGERQAQAYIVGELQRLGVEPAGENGYYQTVHFVQRQLVEKESSLALVRAGKVEPLTLGEEAFLGARVDLAPEVDAGLVFVGYGLKVPESGYDDFAGQDLKGKVAVVFTGSPAEMPAALASHYQSTAERGKALRAAGAVGMVTLPNPAFMDIPWPRMTLNRTRPSLRLASAEFDETAGQKVSVTFNPAHAEKLFQGTGHTFQEIAALGKDRKPLPRFALPVSLRARAQVQRQDVESTNVVARLTGSDSALKNECVVVSAHIDHVGVREPINGDRVYNGAMDNASGSALVLDMARALRAAPAKPKRSVLFLWVTGEEHGLLGSRYFAAHPTVPPDSMVANLNTDMFLPIVPLKVLTVYGLAESDLGDRVSRVAAKEGVRVQPDRQPIRNIFIRSDQYNFIRRGIPSLAMQVGFEPGTPEEKVFKDWLTERYHAPGDDTNQPVDLSAAAGFEDVMLELVRAVADDPQRPAWKADSFFRRFVPAGGPTSAHTP
jgi:Zn-dependent M28 family amino/carboxypeptidase